MSRTALLGLITGLVLTSTAHAQVAPQDRAALETLTKEALARYEAAARETPAARENLQHVRRMLDLVESRSSQLRELGIDPRAVRAGIVFSDLGKNGGSLAPLAKELFPKEFANEATRGGAFFKAFLLHEVPGRKLFRDMATKAGLSPGTIRAVEAANVGHNGPAAEGSWWQGAWDAQIKNGKGPIDLSGPHGELVREYAGKSYPEVSSIEGAVHTALDRRDQGTRDGSLKIMAEEMARGKSLREAFNELFGNNQRRTQLQFDSLRARFPKIFELDIVQDAERAVQETVRYRNHVQFNKDGNKARVHMPDGKVIEVAGLQELSEALRRIEKPSPTRVRHRGVQPRTLSQIKEAEARALASRTIPELLAEARRKLGRENVKRPFSRASLVSQLTGLSPETTARTLRTRTATPVAGRKTGATRRLKELLPRNARSRGRPRGR